MAATLHDKPSRPAIPRKITRVASEPAPTDGLSPPRNADSSPTPHDNPLVVQVWFPRIDPSLMSTSFLARTASVTASHERV